MRGEGKERRGEEAGDQATNSSWMCAGVVGWIPTRMLGMEAQPAGLFLSCFLDESSGKAQLCAC